VSGVVLVPVRIVLLGQACFSDLSWDMLGSMVT
jgi:hypothetical protein